MRTTPASTHSPDPLTDDPPSAWHVIVFADHGSLLLARVLQKFAVPEIELLAAHYEVTDTGGAAEVRLHIRARPARARLAATRLHSLQQVRRVELTA